ncbi:hypothetical protein TcasGA2_TC011984 [Tribolium castaneum]|uniref:Uncharacterized protein n=1 Tax=Tribolium castaneum TaxID=7070 RepID=D6X2Q7_TRICA|nr:hypothetical protein TcasGA2_TC011984 [Tribolium castaneum]
METRVTRRFYLKVRSKRDGFVRGKKDETFVTVKYEECHRAESLLTDRKVAKSRLHKFTTE